MATNRSNRSPVKERGGNAGGEHQVRGLEPDMVLVDARLSDGVEQHGEQHDRGRHQHDGRQSVGDECDAERGRPVTDLYDDDPLAVDVDEDHDRQRDECGQRRDADDPLHQSGATTQDRQGGGDQGRTIGPAGWRSRHRSDASDRAPAREQLGAVGRGTHVTQPLRVRSPLLRTLPPSRRRRPRYRGWLC